MFSFNMVRWLKTLYRSRVKTIVKKPRFRLSVEELETRLAPATFTWTGNGVDRNWSTATNWGGNNLSAATPGPIDLVFNSNAAAFLSNDNIAGLAVNSITIAQPPPAYPAAGGFRLTATAGVTLTLGNPLASGSSGFITDQSQATDSIAIPIQLAGAGSSQQFITVATGTTLTISGQLTGTSGSQLTKEGVGVLILSADNSGFIGPFTIDHDAGSVQITNAKALGGVLTSTVDALKLNNGVAAPPASATKFTLQFGAGAPVVGVNVTTPITYTGTSADSAAVQTALNALTAITGGGGSVQVYQTNDPVTFAETFFITFTGTFTGTSVASQITGAVTASPASFNAPVVTAGGAASPYVVSVGNNSQLQLGAIVGGVSTAVAGGAVANTVQLAGLGAANAGALYNFFGSNTWSGSVVLETDSYLSAAAATTLTISGVVSDAGSHSVTKIGAGTLVLSNANTYFGATNIQDGILQIQNPKALGSTPSAGTFVLDNTTTGEAGSLQLAFVAPVSTPTNSQYYILQDPSQAFNVATNPYVGFVVPNYQLHLLGPGFGGNFTFGNVTGDNAWSGPVTLETAPANGLNAVNIEVDAVGAVQTQLVITGVIGDQNPAQPATLNKATGALPFIGTGNLVLEPTIHTASVDLGNTYKVVTLPGGYVDLTQFGGTGTANTYLGSTNVGFINGGTVTLEDSQGLGPTSKTTKSNVGQGSSLNLVSNVGHIDSITGVTNKLLVDAPLTLNGPGYQINGQDAGTIHNISGINTYGPNLAYNAANPASPYVITVSIFNGTIGVESDPNPTANNNYFTNDYSLTITGGLASSNFFTNISLTKLRPGQLILPNSNEGYFGTFDIKSGWITIQDPDSLGLTQAVVQEVQATDTVESGAALMLKPIAPGTSFTFTHNLILQGTGITHAFSLINQKGALENLGGVNSLSSNIQLIGQTGIGVEQVDPTVPSDLTMLGETSEPPPPPPSPSPAQVTGGISAGAPWRAAVGTHSHGQQVGELFFGAALTEEQRTMAEYDLSASSAVTQALFSFDVTGIKGVHNFGIDVNAYVGNNSVTNADFSAPAINALPLFNFTTGGLAVGQTFTVDVTSAFNTLVGSSLGLRLQASSDPGNNTSDVTVSFGNFSLVIVNPASPVGGIIKLGSQRLNMQGAGLYTGGVDIREGVLRDLNNLALGSPGSGFGTTVETGAALELTTLPTDVTGGVSTGAAIWNNHLTLNGLGNSTFGDAPLTVLAKDNLWHGPITLNSNVAIAFQGVLANQAIPTMTANIRDTFGVPTLTGTNPTVAVTTTNAGVQSLNFTSMTANVSTFKLSFNGVSTASITYTGTADDATTIQNALNSLSTILNIGSVSETQTVPDPGNGSSSFLLNFRSTAAGRITAQILSGSGSVTTATTGQSAVQALTFGGIFTDVGTGYFTISGVQSNGANFTTGHIIWSANQNVLIANIQAALTPVFGAHNFNVFISSPTIDTTPNSRLIVTGTIDDGAGTTVTAPNPLIHDYEFQGTLADSPLFGGPALINTGGSVNATNYSWAAVAGANQGLTLPVGGLPSLNNYAVEMHFHFNTQPGINNTYSRILDFKNRTSDNGLYDTTLGAGTGSVQPYPGPTSGTADFMAGVDVNVIITRDVAGQVLCYINGVPRLNFLDAAGDFISTGTLNFFIDDNVVKNEVGGGAIDKIRIYSRVLTPAEVTTLVAGGTVGGTTMTGGSGMPSDLTVAGGGELLLAGNNTYRGTTYVNQGTLTIQNGQALGGTAVAGAQQLALIGAVGGATQFQLYFDPNNGPVMPANQTAPIPYTGTDADAVAIQTALNGLSSITSAFGAVTVIQTGPGNFLITFGAALVGTTANINASVSSGPGSAVAGPEGGTVVANNAQIQLEGGVTVPGEPLILQGKGSNQESSVETFTVGASTTPPTAPSGTYTLNFNGVNTTPLPFNATAQQVQSALQTVLDANFAGAQALVGQTGTSAGTNEEQKFTFIGINPGPFPPTDTFQLYFDPAGGAQALNYNLTPPIAYTGNAFTDKDNIIAALDKLQVVLAVGGSFGHGPVGGNAANEFAGISFLGGLADAPQPLVQIKNLTGGNIAGHSIVVTHNPTGSTATRTFSVTFQGTYAGLLAPLLTVPAITGTTTVTAPVFETLGGSANATPLGWFSVGPAPVTNAQVFNPPGGTKQNEAGRVTGIDVINHYGNALTSDIYISTAGGGLWRTIDGGQHWTQQFDNVNNSVTFGGAVAFPQNTPSNIYYGGGEGNNSGDSYYGTGVYFGNTLLTNPDGSNPLAGKAINKIIVNPARTFEIWVAVSDRAVNGIAGNTGIWRYDGVNWLNMTAGAFPTNVPYSDLAFDGTKLYAAIGASGGSAANDVIVSNNPTAAAPTWTASNIAALLVSGPVGNIKLSSSGANTAYAAVANAVTGGLLGIIKTVNGGATWAIVADRAIANIPDYLTPQGWYDSAIVASGNNIFVGGVDVGGGTNFVLWSNNGGTTWKDISQDAGGIGPHTDVHALALDGANNLLVGSDGGVWRASLNYAAFTLKSWTNLNGDLATLLTQGVSTQPGNTGVIVASDQEGGTIQFTGAPIWTQTFDGDGNAVRFVPGAPATVYQITSTNGINGKVKKSIDSGATWTPLQDAVGNPISGRYLVVDPNDASRLLVGGFGLMESSNFGANNSWITLNAPGSLFVAAAEYQGNFVTDKYFPMIGNVGSNTYVPGIIYAADRNHLYVTKNHGAKWTGVGAGNSDRTPPLLAGSFIKDVEVDPSNSNTVLVVTNGAPGAAAGTGIVFESTDAGQTWTDISAGLPLIPVTGAASWSVLPAWKIAIDARTKDLYLGTDLGVYKLTGGVGNWQRFGAGLPNVQVKDLEIDTTANVLTIATYGRGVWQFYLDNTQADQGALRALSGQDIWTGPITLAGPTTISAAGSQALQNGLSGAQLTLRGSISDSTLSATTTAANTLTKIGGGDVILQGINTYGGLTDVQQGNLVVQNPHALGASGANQGTKVESGAALELASDLLLEPVTLNGNGILPPYNGHYTGALVNVSNANTYTGTITLNTSSTIGVQAGSLTINSANPLGITDNGAGYSLDKEGSGTLFLLSPDNYGGGTTITAGAINIQTPLALGTGTSTVVSDGAQLQLQQSAGSPSGLNVTGETLYLSGSGLATDGVLRNVVGNNTWAGNVILTSLPNFTPASSPQGVVAIYVDPNNTLTLAGVVSEGAPPQPANVPATTVPASGLAEIGLGTLVLANANTYTGSTYVGYTFGVADVNGSSPAGVPGGAIDIQNSNALGQNQGNEIQRISTYDPPGANDAFTLTFNGQTTAAIPYGTPGALPAGPTGPTATPAAGGSLGAGTYYYEITALLPDGIETLPSTEVNAVLVGGVNKSVSLTWAGIGTAIGYKVYRTTVSGNYSLPSGGFLGTAPTNSYSDTGATALTAGSPPTTVQIALNALSSIGANGVSVTGTTVYTGISAVQTLTLTNAESPKNQLTLGVPSASNGGNLAAVTTYFYVVTATGPTGATNGETIASAQQSVATTGTNKTINLTWGLVAGATGYKIYRSTNTGNFTQALLTTVSSATSSYIDSGPLAAGALAAPVQNAAAPASGGNLTAGVPLFYVITATNAFGESFSSNQVTITPAGINLANTLSWAAVPGATGYRVYRSILSGNFSNGLVAVISSAATTTFTDTGAAVSASFTPPTQTMFTLKVGSGAAVLGANLTAPIPYTGFAATDQAAIQAALQGLTAIGSNNATVSADATDTIFTITFAGTLSDAQQAAIVPAVTQSTATAVVSEATPGNGGPSYVYTVTFNGANFTGVSQPLIGVPATNSALVAAVSQVATGGIGTLVYTGSSLEIDGDPNHTGASITVPFNAPAGNTIALNGTGLGGSGALLNVSGNNTLQANVVLQSSSSLAAAATTQLTITGAIQDPALPAANPIPTSSPASLTKIGAGTIALAPPNTGNTYAGNTFVNAGVLNIQDKNALGFSTSAVEKVSVFGSSGSFALTFNGQTTAPIQYAATAAQVQSALNALPLIGANGVLVTYDGTAYSIYFNGPGLAHLYQNPLTYQIVTTGITSIVITHPLAGGATNIDVASGATLQMQSNTVGPYFSEASGKYLTIAGLGFNGAGALENVSGTNAWNATPITLGTSPAAIGADAGSTLNINKPITDSFLTPTIQFGTFAVGDTYSLSYGGAVTGLLAYTGVNATDLNTIKNALIGLSSVIPLGGTVNVVSPAANTFNVTFANTLYGTFAPGIGSIPVTSANGAFVAPSGPATSNGDGVNKVGGGTVQFNAGNTYTGLTNVVAGALVLDNLGAGFAVPGNLTVGDNTPVSQVQGLDLSTFSQGNTFTLKYNGSAASAPIAYYANATLEASLIQSALNSLTTIGGLSPTAGSVTVTPSGAGKFLITFGGNLAGTLAFTAITATNINTAAIVSSTATAIVGGPPAANSAIAQFLANNQVQNSASVIVNSDGLFDLNNQTQALASLTVNAGTATTGAIGGTLTLGTLTIADGILIEPGNGLVTVNGAVTMTGGTINLLGALSQLVLGAGSSVAASSDAIGTANITGPGKVNLGNATRTFNVTHGATASVSSDLDISAVITGTVIAGSPALTKTGTGRLELDALETYPGDTTISQGDVQTDGLGTTQTITLFGAIAGTTKIALSYNGLTSAAITYSGAQGTDQTAFQNAVAALLGVPAGSVTVNVLDGATDTIFQIICATLLGPIMPAITSNPGTTGNAFLTLPNNVGNVVLSGATSASASLSGNGAVASISAAGIGTVNPGVNKASPTHGILNVNSALVLGANDTFFVDLANPSGTHPNPVAGSDYDQLSVNGTVTLGNALLSGSVGAGAQALSGTTGDKFTVIQATGGINGQFDGIINGARAAIPQDGVVFLNGQKCTVHYFSNSVVLTHVLESLTSFSLASSVDPSAYGQPVIFTATLVPEAGASFATGVPQVTFHIDSLLGSFTDFVAAVPVSGVVTFSPMTSPTYSPLLLQSGTTSFMVHAKFDEPNVFVSGTATPTGSLSPSGTQTVKQNTVSVGVSSSPASPVYGQTVTVVATLTPIAAPSVPGASNPTGNVRFILDGGSPIDVAIDSPYAGPPALRTATLQLPDTLLLSPGPHTLTVTYLGDPNYSASIGTVPASPTVTIGQDSSSLTFTPAPVPSFLGQNATFNVKVARVNGTSGHPTGTVSFYDGDPLSGGTLINSSTDSQPVAINSANGTASFATNMLTLGGHTIFAVYSGDANYLGVTSSTAFTVNLASTATSFVSESPANPRFGDQVTFTINVAPPSPGINASYGLPTGSVTIWQDVTASGAVSAATVIAGNDVKITSVGHGLATGDKVTISNINGSIAASANGTFTITKIDNDNFRLGIATGSGTYTNGGTWTKGGINLATGAVDSSSGQAIILTAAPPAANALTQGTHVILAVYSGDATFGTSSKALSPFVVQAAATMVTSVTANPASGDVFGGSVTLTATVTTNIGTLVGPSSSVTFVDTTTGTLLGTGPLVAGNTASITTALLNANTIAGHTITATYNDTSNNHASSSNTLTGYLVAQAPTTVTTVSATPASGDVYGSSVTLSATVTASAGSLPVGAGSLVTFFDTTTNTTLGTGAINGAGQASLPTTALTANTHTITATYSDTFDNNYANSSNTLSGYLVAQVPTTVTTVTANPTSGDVFGQTVMLTANVTGGVPNAANNVTFVDTTTSTTLGFGSTVGGTATLSTTALTANTTTGHTITATYTDPAGNFAPSSNALTGYMVAKANSSVALVSSVPFPAAATVNQTVMFTATVTNFNFPATTVTNVPAGSTVTFIDTPPIGPITTVDIPINASGVAIWSPSFSAAGNHTITAQYNIHPTMSPNFNFSNIATLTQRVRLVSTPHVSPNPIANALFGTTLNYTFSVTGSPSTPGGNVAVTDNGSAIAGSPFTLNGSGAVTGGINISGLTVGTRSLVFTYSGDGNFAASSVTVTQPVLAATTTTLASTAPLPAGSSHYGQAVTFQATVTASGAANPTTGTVYFIDATAGTLLGSVAVNGSSQASYTTTSSQLVTLGNHTIEAVFAGNNPYANSPLSNTLTQTVTQAITDTTITAAMPGPSAYGQAVTFTATVTAETGSPLPTTGAYMFFYIDGTFVGSAATPTSHSGPTATYTFTTTATQMAAGNHAITALWISPADAGGGNGGDNAKFKSSLSPGFGGTSGAFMQTVNPAATTTLLASSPTYWAVGSPVTFYALVYCSGPGSPGVPTGSVTFIVDGVSTTKALDNVSGPYAYTTFTVPAFTAGSHSVSVTYNQAPAVPMPNFAASAAATQTQNVRKATSIALSSSSSGTLASQVTFTATVSTNATGGPPTGAPTFSVTDGNGANIAGTVTPVSSSPTSAAYRFTPSSPLPAGTYHVTAHYNGDTNFDPADPTAALTITISNGRLT
jgi:autotransporter-associated beta strand protein